MFRARLALPKDECMKTCRSLPMVPHGIFASRRRLPTG